MTNEHLREPRFTCHGKASLFLTDRTGQNALTERLHGRLLDISCHGASLALAEIMTNRRHMAYAPMESALINLHIVLYLEEGELIIPVKTTWFNKKISAEDLPFRIGLEFDKPITLEQLKKISAPS